MLQRITKALGEGDKGPDSFNQARLFLIAKTDLLLIQDTRPISVTVCANRIVASCLASAITPLLQAFLEKSQKGFCPERVGTEHVHGLTSQFYGALSKKQQMFILSLDTARAFDSISHKFISTLLRHIELPEWAVKTVEGLLHKVSVKAMLAGEEASAIQIRRGVKQGCPFSPLLFILCFDVLLYRLKKTGLTAYAYADDLALVARDTGRIEWALGVIRSFSEASGLGLNAKKTVLVGTRPLRNQERNRLDDQGWELIREAPSCTYLGVAVGPKITTEEVFAGAKKKFDKRLALYRPFLKKTSLNTRIMVANVFLLPLFYYLCQFYVAHWSTVVQPVQRALHAATVAFRGTAFGYAHLLLPRGKGGPHTPLRDLWSTNIAMLAARHDMEESEECPIPATGVKGHKYWPLTQYRGGAMDKCMTTDGHAAHSAFTFLEYFADRDKGHRIDLGKLPKASKAAARRSYVYRILADRVYEKERSEVKRPASLPAKIGRFIDVAGGDVHFRGNAKKVSPGITPAVWNTQLRLMYNALPFENRRRDANMAIAPRSRRICVEHGADAGGCEEDSGDGDVTETVLPETACYFCGDGPDSARHVYSECEVIREARKQWGDKLGCVLGDGCDITLLAFPPVDNPAVAPGIVSFNWAVWAERSEYLPTLGFTPGQ